MSSDDFFSAKDALDMLDSLRLPQDFHNRVHNMSKRELFAAMAMQGWLGSQASTGGYKALAKEAVQYADALLEELNKPIPEPRAK